MGQELRIALERDIGVDADIAPMTLLGGDSDLHELAVELGIAPLWSFYSASLEAQAAMKTQFPMTPEDIEAGRKHLPPERWCELEFNCPEEWFEASDGLETVRGLHKYLLADPAIPDVEYYIEALEEVERVLEAARVQNVRFHFSP